MIATNGEQTNKIYLKNIYFFKTKKYKQYIPYLTKLEKKLNNFFHKTIFTTFSLNLKKIVMKIIKS